MSEEFVKRHMELMEILKKHDVLSIVDWLEKLDKRVSVIEEKMK